MTWRELFRRAWLVLRLRFKRFHVCEECGDIEEPRECGSMAGTIILWECPSCEEFAKLERAKPPIFGAHREEDHNIYLRQLVARQNEAAMANHVAWAASRPLDPALLQNQIGAPIRVPAHYLNPGLGGFVIGEIGSAIGSAIELLPFKDYLT